MFFLRFKKNLLLQEFAIRQSPATIPEMKMKTKSISIYNESLTVMHIAYFICDYKNTFIGCLRWSFLIKAKRHHALMCRECKSINTYFL